MSKNNKSIVEGRTEALAEEKVVRCNEWHDMEVYGIDK